MRTTNVIRSLACVAVAILVVSCSGNGSGSSSSASTSSTHSGTSAAPTDPTAPPQKMIYNTDLLQSKLNVTGADTVPVFESSFDVADEGERRVVRAMLSVASTTDRLLLDQTLTCTSPSGVEKKALESGQNVLPSQDNQVVFGQFILEPNETGTWKCASNVRVCIPGDCSSPGGSGIIDLVTVKQDPNWPSALAISVPLPSWSQNLRAGDAPVVVQSGGSGTLSTTFDNVPLDQGPIELMGTISLTNCIEPNYPAQCKDVTTTGLQTDSVVVPKFTMSQLGGSGCPTTEVSPDWGAWKQTITWKQHHGMFAFIVPSFDLSADCDPSVQVDLTFTVKSGNGIVIERGTVDRPTSVVSLVPAPKKS